MATSREVVDRLRWDARFDARRFVIGFREGDGVREVPLPAWDGTVPWHRVLHVARDDGLVVWDRARGLDLVTSGAALEPAAPPPDEGAFEPVATHRFVAGAWTPCPPEDAAPGPLRVAFWNVLSDRHDPEATRLEPRLPGLLAALRARDADVLALVEVTRRMLAALLADPWVRATYRASDVTGDTLGPEGPLLLCRRPFTAVVRRFDNGKRALVGRLAGPRGPLAVAVVHLTSDQARDAASKRAAELAAVAHHLAARAGAEDALLAGDLNTHHDDPGGLLAAGFIDCWRALRPADPGFTFRPQDNALAARTSRRLLPARFDRLLLRGGLEPRRVERFGADPPASDHDGLALDLDRPTRHEAPPSPRAALALLPPPDLWPALDALRAAHDPALGRWPPHVNLLFGFVPPDHEARALVARATARHAPFRVALRRFDVLEHGRGATVHLVPEPDPPDAFARLWADVAARFPRCATREAFVPHLTVGRAASAAEARALAARLQAGWAPVGFEARALTLLGRAGDDPFAVAAEVPLGGALERWLAERGDLEPDPARREAVRARVEAACREAFGAVEVHVTGSTRLGAALAWSDLDLVVLARGVDLPAVARALERGLARARVTPHAVRLEVDGLPVDVQVAPPEAPVAAEADALLAAGGARVGADRFREVLLAVRAWARARRLDAQAWGLPGGVAWAVLTAWALGDADPDDGPERLLAHVFARAAAHPWPAPMALGDPPWSPGPRDVAPILTPAPPVTNAWRTATPSTRAVVAAEVARAADLSPRVLAGEATWHDLAQVPSPGAGHAHVLVVDPAADDPDDLDARGALEGRGVALVLALEAAPGVRRVRPYALRGAAPVFLGLDLAPGADVAAVARAALGPGLRWGVDS
ncbi:MAG: RNA repair domain-containing protein [Planctomycetes bacterium]|nr:RNA repair domain-containing protein [Planctomycetota bacterium]